MKEEFQIFWSESLPQSLLRTLLFKKVNLVENSSQLSRYLNQDKSFSTNQKKINQLFSPFALYTIFIRIYLSLSDFHSISAICNCTGDTLSSVFYRIVCPEVDTIHLFISKYFAEPECTEIFSRRRSISFTGCHDKIFDAN